MHQRGTVRQRKQHITSKCQNACHYGRLLRADRLFCFICVNRPGPTRLCLTNQGLVPLAPPGSAAAVGHCRNLAPLPSTSPAAATSPSSGSTQRTRLIPLRAYCVQQPTSAQLQQQQQPQAQPQPQHQQQPQQQQLQSQPQLQPQQQQQPPEPSSMVLSPSTCSQDLASAAACPPLGTDCVSAADLPPPAPQPHIASSCALSTPTAACCGQELRGNPCSPASVFAASASTTERRNGDGVQTADAIPARLPSVCAESLGGLGGTPGQPIQAPARPPLPLDQTKSPQSQAHSAPPNPSEPAPIRRDPSGHCQVLSNGPQPPCTNPPPPMVSSPLVLAPSPLPPRGPPPLPGVGIEGFTAPSPVVPASPSPAASFQSPPALAPQSSPSTRHAVLPTRGSACRTILLSPSAGRSRGQTLSSSPCTPTLMLHPSPLPPPLVAGPPPVPPSGPQQQVSHLLFPIAAPAPPRPTSFGSQVKGGPSVKN